MLVYMEIISLCTAVEWSFGKIDENECRNSLQIFILLKIKAGYCDLVKSKLNQGHWLCGSKKLRRCKCF